MSSWLQPLRALLQVDSIDLRDLAHSVGANPNIYYVNQDLSSCDLRGQDLRGMDLTGTQLCPQQMNEDTLVDPRFDPRYVFQDEFVTFRLSLALTALVYAFADEYKYRYRAWAFKNIVERAVSAMPNSISVYSNFIDFHDNFLDLIVVKRSGYRVFNVKISSSYQKAIHDWSYTETRLIPREIHSRIILIGLLISKLPNISSQDLDLLTPLSLYKGASEYFSRLKSNKLR